MGADLGSIRTGGKQIRKSNIRNKIGDIIRILIITSVLGHEKNFRSIEIHPKLSRWEKNIWMYT